MSNTDWGKKFEEAGALWRMNYDNEEGGHALLTSGKHSDAYSNGAKIVQNPQMVEAVIADLLEKIKQHEAYQKPDWVVGPAYGAVTYAHEAARQLDTKYAFTEIEYTDEGKMQVLKRFDIAEGDVVLVIEDLKTTGGSAQKTIDVVEAVGANVLPMVGFITNWTEPKIGERDVISLIEPTMNIWESDECPLCEKGSEAVRPKYDWDKLAR